MPTAKERKRNRAAFQLVAGHPILDFVNTLDWRFRPQGTEELLPTYADLLRFCGQAGLLSRVEIRKIARRADSRASKRALTSARRFREAVAGVLYGFLDKGSPAETKMATLRIFVAAAQRERRFEWRNDRFVWRWTREAEQAAELPLWKLCIEAAGLLASQQMAAVKVCRNEECRWLFLDTSKSHSRKWCDMKLCGNRLKARRFRSRR